MDSILVLSRLEVVGCSILLGEELVVVEGRLLVVDFDIEGLVAFLLLRVAFLEIEKFVVLVDRRRF